MKKIRVVLAGQPNVGKSMLINSISNSSLRVGNFSGVTVEKSEVSFKYKDYEINIVDLPGTYALSEYTIDEKVAKNFLLDENYDLIVNVVDSTNLERNLNLTTELLELNKKMIVALNMADEAKKEKVAIDTSLLSEILGVVSIPVSASTKEGIDNLIEKIIDTYNSKKQESKVIYSDLVEEEILKIETFLIDKKFLKKDTNGLENFSYREIAVNILKEDKLTFKKIHDNPIWVELQLILNQALEKIYIKYDTKDLEEIFIDEHHSFVKGAVTETVKRKNDIKKSITEKIDSILIHPIVGIPIFLFLMWGLFQITFELGSVPMDWIDAGFATFGDAIGENISNDNFRSLLVDGIIAGVGAVIMFLPNIMILFFGIALLETTGYMARVAFLLDGFFHKFGLHGKSFIPLVSGFGCSVPAYMSARTLKNEKDRLLTLFIIGFMSCGAKLPVYVLFAGAFFAPEVAGNVLFGIYIAGALFGLILAKVLRVFIFKGEDEAFVMEMPKYRMPSLQLIWFTVWNKALMYLKKAGTFILMATILIWFASNYPKNSILEEDYATKIENTQIESEKLELQYELSQKLLEQSYLGIIGKTTEPFFAPLGFDWKLTVALETGLAAKEIVVATMGVLYSLGDEVDEENSGLIQKLQAEITLPIALSFIAFAMVYMPCLAATVVFVREAGSYKYLWFLIIFTTITAWTLAFITYNLAKFLL